MMRNSTIWSLLLIVALAAGGPAVAEKPTIIESYQGNAMMMTGGGGSSVATVNIYRWSADEEREEILEAIKYTTDNPRHNDRKVAQALRGLSKTGYAFFAGRQGYPLRYARKFDMGGGKYQIVLATDRPVSFQEAYQQTQMGDYDVTILLLKVDESGKGEGILSVGTEVRWNNETNKLDVTNMSSQPIKIEGVHQTK